MRTTPIHAEPVRGGAWVAFLVGFVVLWGVLTGLSEIDATGRIGLLILAAVSVTAVLVEVIVCRTALRDAVAVLGLGRTRAGCAGLGATVTGLGFHHMNQITDRIDRDTALRAPDVFADRSATMIGVPAGTGLVSFRVGRPEREALPSPRRELSDIVRR